jgi:hypothetical protein
MLDSPGIGDNHNVPVFRWCYKRMGPRLSPSEMALPDHPDVAYEFVKTLTGCGCAAKTGG